MNEKQKEAVRRAIEWNANSLKDAKDTLEYHRSKVDEVTNRVATLEKEKSDLHQGLEQEFV